MRNRLVEGYNGNGHWVDQKDAERLKDDFETRATVKDGIVRWNSNGSIPPQDILEFWNYLRKPFDYELTLRTEQEETASFLQNYAERMKNHKPSEEELFEMRSAFGEGNTVVNAVTGRKIKL